MKRLLHVFRTLVDATPMLSESSFWRSSDPVLFEVEFGNRLVRSWEESGILKFAFAHHPHLQRFRQAEYDGWGSAEDPQEAIGPVMAWLSGDKWVHIVERYPAVERNRKELLEAWRLAIDPVAQLRVLPVDVRRLLMDSVELTIGSGDRQIVIQGARGATTTLFLEFGCLKATTRGPKLQAGLFSQWLLQQGSPSSLFKEGAAQPPTLNGPSSSTRAEWSEAWKVTTEGWWAERLEKSTPAAIALLLELRLRFGRSLRPGTSMYTLMFSRSLHHGLKPLQPFVGVSFRPASFVVHCSLPGFPDQPMCFSYDDNASLVRIMSALSSHPPS